MSFVWVDVQGEVSIWRAEVSTIVDFDFDILRHIQRPASTAANRFKRLLRRQATWLWQQCCGI